MDIHQYAVVSPEAKIGEGVKIGPFVTIDANVEIGDGTIIDSNAVIRSGARIGRNCHIHSGAVVSDVPQDLKFKGEETLAIVGDGTVISRVCYLAPWHRLKGRDCGRQQLPHHGILPCGSRLCFG